MLNAAAEQRALKVYSMAIWSPEYGAWYAQVYAIDSTQPVVMSTMLKGMSLLDLMDRIHTHIGNQRP